MKLSPVLRVLEELYDSVRAEHPGLPVASITIDFKPGKNVAYAYRGKIVVRMSAVRRGGEYLVATILHEAAHLLQYEQHQGVGRHAHDSFFMDACGELGLNEYDELTPETRGKYLLFISTLDHLVRPERQ